MLLIQGTYKFKVILMFASLLLCNVVLSEQKDVDKKGAFLGGMETEYPDWFKDSFLDLSDDIEEATESGKRFAIIFQQDGCPYCNALIERNFSQQEIVNKSQKHFDFTTINIWGDREVTNLDGKDYIEKTFAQEMKVQFTPTIIFYDEQGRIALRINGYHRPDIFSLELDYVLGKHEKTTTYRDFMLANRSKIRTKDSIHEKALSAQESYSFDKKLKNKAPFAVFFEQQDCPACDVLHDDVMADKEVQKVIDGLDISRVNMWGRAKVVTPNGEQMMVREWARKLNVKYAPTVIIFDQTGKEVIRSEAFFKVFHTQALFNYVRSEAYKKESNFQRYVSAYAEHVQESGQDVDIWRTTKEGAK